MLSSKVCSMARACGLALLFAATASAAQAQNAAAEPAPDVQVGALNPANLAKKRPKPPFNLTGTWFVDLSGGMSFAFGPPYPKFTAEAQKFYDEGQKARKEGKAFHDDIGQCFPAGLPMIMTRVWAIAMIQLPTAIYMVSGFNNALRIVYLDGRPHMDPDVVVRSFNGESIGKWEGDTLVVDSTAFVSQHHWIDTGIPVSEQLRIVERIRMLNNGNTLEIRYSMTDPVNWEGEWASTKRWKRVDADTDITEVECLPDLNDHLPSTRIKP